MILSELPIYKGQVEVLQQGVKEGRLPHAQYFEYKAGAAGLALGIAYAQEILAGEPDMFGGMDTRASRLEHPDLHMVFPMVQSDDKTCDSRLPELRVALQDNPFLSYEQWVRLRAEKQKKAIISKHEAESITKKLSLRAYEGGKKILIVWMAELMNVDCANKLLKLIEEPPADTLIIMLGHDASQLLPTVYSRVQVTQLPTLSTTELVAAAGLVHQGKNEDLMHLALASEGSISAILDRLDEDVEKDMSPIFTWLRSAYAKDVPGLINWSDAQAGSGKETVLQMLKACSEVIHTAWRANYLGVMDSGDEVLDAFCKRFAPFVHALNIEQLNTLIDTAIRDIERNGNLRIILLDTSFQLIRAIHIPLEQNQAASQ